MFKQRYFFGEIVYAPVSIFDRELLWARAITVAGVITAAYVTFSL